MTGSLHSSPETITTLLTAYIPMQKESILGGIKQKTTWIIIIFPGPFSQNPYSFAQLSYTWKIPYTSQISCQCLLAREFLLQLNNYTL